MDVQKPSDIADAVKQTQQRWDRIDGLVHSVAFAPQDALGGNFLQTPWESVATAVQVSAFSFKEMARAFLPLMKENGGSMETRSPLTATISTIPRPPGPSTTGWASPKRRWNL